MRRSALITLLLCVALCCGRWPPAAAAAGESPDQPTAHEAGGDAAHGEEHASPNLFSGDLGNAVWTLVIFLLVVWVLGRFAWKPILGALQQREEFIRKSLADAKKDRADAEARLKQHTEQLNKAREEATAIVEEGRRDAEVVRRQIHEEARAEADAMIDRAKREIGIARDTAIKDLYEVTAEMATEVARRLIRRQLSPDEQRRLVEESIDELSKLSGDGRS